MLVSEEKGVFLLGWELEIEIEIEMEEYSGFYYVLVRILIFWLSVLLEK